MYSHHSVSFIINREEWMMDYPVRNLNAYSANPILVKPTHYWGMEGHISDTGELFAVLQKGLEL